MHRLTSLLSSRATVLALLLMAALLAGLALSSAVTLRLLAVESKEADWSIYLDYLKHLDAPAFRPYAGQVKAGGWIGFGFPGLIWIGVAAWMMWPRRRSLHGDARFAHAAELAAKGLLKVDGQGIVIGRHRGRLVRLPGQQFVLLAAPTRSGKGVGIVIPNLLEYLDSVVVLDIKFENFKLTSGWRASQGHEVFLFNPFAADQRTHRWNPLRYVSGDPMFRVSDLMAIAAMVYPEAREDQRFWVSQARNAFMAFALYLFDQYADGVAKGFPLARRPTFGAIYRLSSGIGTDSKSHFRALAARPFLSPAARMAFSNLLSQADETFASIMGTLKEPLNAWINPVLDAATEDDDFLLSDVRKKRMTIYVGIQPDKLAESRLVLNLFFSQLINQNTRELPQTNPELKHQCLLLMDEFTAIGRIDIIATAVAYMAGYNLRLLPIIQSLSQLDAVYGREVSRTMVTNHALQIVFTPRDQRDANEYSEMLGYTTVRRKSVTRGREVSRSEVLERRALMLPQELKAMDARKAIFFYEGIAHPVMCERIVYFRDRHFTRRLLPEVEVPLLWNFPATESQNQPLPSGMATCP